MSWFKDEELKLNWFEKLAVNVIKQGKVPQHVKNISIPIKIFTKLIPSNSLIKVAIIMDGNRRFSVKSHIHKAEGHKMGFEKLSQALQWCADPSLNVISFSNINASFKVSGTADQGSDGVCVQHRELQALAR